MIDWERINELMNDIGKECFAEVAGVFMEEVAEVIARLKINPTPDNLEEELHFLKGSALNLGFMTLSTLCHKGEQQAANKDYFAISLVPIFEACDKSFAEFNAKGF